MNYLNRFKQISDEAAEALQSLVSDMINNNTTNILEVGTYAGQVTLRLAAAASNSSSVRVISIDPRSDMFSPSAKESLKASNFFNTDVQFGDLDTLFEKNIVKSNIIYIDRFNNTIGSKIELIKKTVIIPTKVIFRDPRNNTNFPFEITEAIPTVKPRAKKKASVDRAL